MLWRIFDCLVDGISAMEWGYELQSNLATGVVEAVQDPDFIPMVHFDLKAPNGGYNYS